MTATFFGDSSAPLFGYYHPPRGASTRTAAVLLCGPAPQEYMRTHGAFHKLAEMLSREGIAALRFDYYGTGDSAGDIDTASLRAWQSNVATAAQELRDLAAVSRISAVGFRLGAMLAASSGVPFQDLVLWEPVVTGEDYMRHLELIQRVQIDRNPRPPWRLFDRPEELLGFRMTRSHEAELRAIELHRQPRPDAERITVAVSQASALAHTLVAAWSAEGRSTNLLEVPDEATPSGQEDLQAALLSNVMLKAIVSRLSS
jgi:uncharacterized protein